MLNILTHAEASTDADTRVSISTTLLRSLSISLFAKLFMNILYPFTKFFATADKHGHKHLYLINNELENPNNYNIFDRKSNKSINMTTTNGLSYSFTR